uniref:Uncharacterized protein n=1 Tax=Tetranychus urticae TaxID=32264 RepID=T1JRG8_TETUR
MNHMSGINRKLNTNDGRQIVDYINKVSLNYLLILKFDHIDYLMAHFVFFCFSD